MPETILAAQTITLRYDDSGPAYRFNRISLDADDQQLYNLANILNSFQADPVAKVIKSTSTLILPQ